jgi:hypothetical protein
MILNRALQLLLVKVDSISLQLLVQWLIIEVALYYGQIFVAGVIYSLALNRFDHWCIGVKLKTTLQGDSRELSTLIKSANRSVVIAELRTTFARLIDVKSFQDPSVLVDTPLIGLEDLQLLSRRIIFFAFN